MADSKADQEINQMAEKFLADTTPAQEHPTTGGKMPSSTPIPMETDNDGGEESEEDVKEQPEKKKKGKKRKKHAVAPKGKTFASMVKELKGVSESFILGTCRLLEAADLSEELCEDKDRANMDVVFENGTKKRIASPSLRITIGDIFGDACIESVVEGRSTQWGIFYSFSAGLRYQEREWYLELINSIRELTGVTLPIAVADRNGCVRVKINIDKSQKVQGAATVKTPEKQRHTISIAELESANVFKNLAISAILDLNELRVGQNSDGKPQIYLGWRVESMIVFLADTKKMHHDKEQKKKKKKKNKKQKKEKDPPAPDVVEETESDSDNEGE